jgi:hypothetical protein
VDNSQRLPDVFSYGRESELRAKDPHFQPLKKDLLRGSKNAILMKRQKARKHWVKWLETRIFGCGRKIVSNLW